MTLNMFVARGVIKETMRAHYTPDDAASLRYVIAEEDSTAASSSLCGSSSYGVVPG